MAKRRRAPRELMEMTVEVMRKSIPEPRSDGKASPVVGALLYKPDGTIETACRGELRDGDHAEFTLLERKNRGNRLDGCQLFATLEPCAPGSRHPSKMACAERIVLARIKEIWIGIEDPDPTVDRKGIKFLQDAGVRVHMFDRDLQEQIRIANEAFIEQAMERAADAAEEEKPQNVMLSSLEEPDTHVELDSLSNKALEYYQKMAHISDPILSPSFRRRLVRQGLMKEEPVNHFVPTGFGALLFAREPRLIMPQAGLLATIHYIGRGEETKNFDGPLVMIPTELEGWLADKLPNMINRSQMERAQIPPVPPELVREAVVNALVHRDYDIPGAKCQLVVTDDEITIRSPGAPLPPISLEQLQSFTAPMLSRNPALHYVFAQIALAEERGLGMKTLRTVPSRYGLRPPQYRWVAPYLDLTIFRAPRLRALLGPDEQAGWDYLSSKGTTSRVEYSDRMGFDDRKTQRHLKRFVELGLLRRVGGGRSTTYEVIGP